MPVLGVTVRELPVSNFDLDLVRYEAYDKNRLPFTVDVKAFFRIEDTNTAA
jgi:flotillin